jgi:hypothetical protein
MKTMTKSAKGKVVLYVEVPPDVKAEMERLAELHNRRLAGEVTTALQEYIARHRAAEEDRAKGGK